MTEVADGEGLEAWLKGKSPVFACVLAARAALRVAPLLFEALHEDAEVRRGAIVLPAFRALAAASFAGAWPERAPEIRKAARVAGREAGEAVSGTSNEVQLNRVEYMEISGGLPLGVMEEVEANARAFSVAERAVDAAVHAIRAAIDTVDAANGIAGPEATFEAAASAVVTAHNAVDGAHGDTALRAALDEDAGDNTCVATHIAEFWMAVKQDEEFLETGRDGKDRPTDLVASLSGKALWHGGTPVWASRKWADLKDKLPEGEGWQVWTDWYEARLAGRMGNETLEFGRVTVKNEDWAQGPTHANAVIAELIEARRDPLIAAVSHGFGELDAVKRETDVDLAQHLNRIRNALPDDPYQAIGATKDMLEATMKTILHRRGVEGIDQLKFPALTSRCLTVLSLEGKSRPATEGERHVRKIASNAKKMIEAANQLRNRAGTGHGYVIGEEPEVGAADASLVAATGMILVAWLLRHDKEA